MAVEFKMRDSSSSYGQLGSLLVVYGYERPTASVAMSYRQCIVELIKRHPEGGMLTVIEDTSTPHVEARNVLIKLFKELGPKLNRASFVIRSSGFAAATQRAMISTMLLATGHKDRFHMSGSVEQGANWLLERVPDPSQPNSARLNAILSFCDEQRQAFIATHTQRTGT